MPLPASNVVAFPLDAVRIQADPYLIPGYASLVRRGASVAFGRTDQVLARYQPGDVIRVCECDLAAIKKTARAKP